MSVHPSDTLSFPSEPVASDAQREASLIARPNVMVVDDEAGIREVLTMMLEMHYNVFPCSTGEQAKETVFNTAIDVAILDIRMPGESGLELLQEIKEASPLIECIMLTGYETLDYTKTALHFGACEFLTKPFSASSLLQTVARAMALRADNDEANESKSLVETLTRKLETSPDVFLSVQAGVLQDVHNKINIVGVYAELLSSFINSREAMTAEELTSFRERFKLIHENVENARDALDRHTKLANGFKGTNSVSNLREEMEDIVALIGRHQDASQARFTLTFDEYPPIPELQESAFIQVIMNLLLNAVQSSTAAQEIAITVNRTVGPYALPENTATCRSVGELSTQPGKNWCVIQITDQGRGVPLEVLEQLSHQHFAARVNQGAAYSLASVISILRNAGGAFTLSTTAGTGTVATVILPVAF